MKIKTQIWKMLRKLMDTLKKKKRPLEAQKNLVPSIDHIYVKCWMKFTIATIYTKKHYDSTTGNFAKPAETVSLSRTEKQNWTCWGRNPLVYQLSKRHVVGYKTVLIIETKFFIIHTIKNWERYLLHRLNQWLCVLMISSVA